MKAQFSILSCCCALLFLVACQPSQPSEPPADQQPASSQTYFPISIGEQALMLQLAVNTAEQQRGLMFRETLADDHGMLFLFERPDQRSFWMRNTQIPLDIGYFDSAGRLLEVHKLFPYDENPVPSASEEILIAVETNQGWFQTNQVTPGALLDMPALKQALKRRGSKHSLLDR